MKKQHFMIFAFVLLFININAQDFFKPRESLGFYIMPQTLIYPNPRLRVGLVYRNTQNVAVSLDVEMRNKLFDAFKTQNSFWTEHYTFFSVRPEVKVYFQNHPNMFYGLSFYYIKMSDIFENGAFESNSSVVNYSSAKYHKNKLGGVIKIGKSFIDTERFQFYTFTGIGLAYVAKTYTDIEGKSILVGGFIPDFPFSHRIAGSGMKFQLVYGFKFGWKFWVKK